MNHKPICFDLHFVSLGQTTKIMQNGSSLFGSNGSEAEQPGSVGFLTSSGEQTQTDLQFSLSLS